LCIGREVGVVRPNREDEPQDKHLGGCTPLGSRLSAKWTRPSYEYFWGSGAAVASLCAARHQYRPVVANKGRLTVPRTDSTRLGGHSVRLGHYLPVICNKLQNFLRGQELPPNLTLENPLRKKLFIDQAVGLLK